MRAFIGSRDADALGADPTFEKRRRKLADRLGNVVATTAARFDMPWDVLAMDDAARRLGALEAAIVSSRFAVRYAEADTTEAPPAPRSLASAPPRADCQRRDRARRASGPARSWISSTVTSSTFGRASCSERRIHLDRRRRWRASSASHIPAYAEAQRRAGRPARVLFFAHGGLDRRVGRAARRAHAPQLLGTQRHLSRLLRVGNGPAGDPSRHRRPSTGPGARTRRDVGCAPSSWRRGRPGKAVWAQMKSSAEKAAGPARRCPAGGGARRQAVPIP